MCSAYLLDRAVRVQVFKGFTLLQQATGLFVYAAAVSELGIKRVSTAK